MVHLAGDMGHVTTVVNPQVVEEGDCRFLPREILQEVSHFPALVPFLSLSLSFLCSGWCCPQTSPRGQELCGRG